MWNLIQNQHRLTDIKKKKLWLPKGKGMGERDKLEVWD